LGLKIPYKGITTYKYFEILEIYFKFGISIVLIRLGTKFHTKRSISFYFWNKNAL